MFATFPCDIPDRSNASGRPAADLPPFTPAMERTLEPVYQRLHKFVPRIEWPLVAPLIFEINRLKAERNAVLLAHNYMTPDIYLGVADIVGDSLQLAIEATRTKAEIIVQCGVHFMAETSKILNPGKTVLIPDSQAGCSLAESIDAADIRALRAANPGVPIVTYVNTSAAVKAECDICCTSSNALRIVESLGASRVLLVPDQYLAQNIAAQTNVEILTFAGACEVHERFSVADLDEYRATDPDVKVLAHPECRPDVVRAADFSGSTSGMISWVRRERPARVMMVTECSMADNLGAEMPDVEFVRPCNLCPHMKRITLHNILDSLAGMKEEIHVDPQIAARARIAIDKMIAASR